MPQTAKYYLGRVVKLGRLTNDAVQEAIHDPVMVREGEYAYTFTDIERGGAGDRTYIFARLTKFFP